MESIDGARLFENSMEALRHCISNPLGQVNIIIDRGMARTPIIIAVEGQSAATNGSAAQPTMA